MSIAFVKKCNEKFSWKIRKQMVAIYWSTIYILK